ncbi:MAG TPA: PaaI family thioesterase [Acidimicrobiales bacterium]|nr:PaaI family thioesterase [Acidimicrobiales bacterium]
MSDPDTRLTTATLEAMPFLGALGAEMITAGADLVTARLAFSERLCTSGGVLHGGVLMGLADSVGGLCAFYNLPAGAAGTSTIESKTNFLRAVRCEWVEAQAQPLHVGRTTIVITTDVSDSEGRLVARTTQTQSVLGGDR